MLILRRFYFNEGYVCGLYVGTWQLFLHYTETCSNHQYRFFQLVQQFFNYLVNFIFKVFFMHDVWTTISEHSLQDNWGFTQHCLSVSTVYFNKTLLVLLTMLSSASSFYKVWFNVFTSYNVPFGSSLWLRRELRLASFLQTVFSVFNNHFVITFALSWKELKSYLVRLY